MKINPPLILHYFKRTGLYVCVNYTQHTHGTCSNLASKLPGQEHQARMFSRGLAGLGALGFLTASPARQAHPLCPHPNILSGSAGLAGASDGQELKRASQFCLPACTFPSCPQGTDP